MALPVIGSKWTASDCVKFFILNVESNEHGTWIYYKRTTDGAEFNCLVDAFLQRFTEDRSYSYP